MRRNTKQQNTKKIQKAMN